jgi:hypothetical protein
MAEVRAAAAWTCIKRIDKKYWHSAIDSSQNRDYPEKQVFSDSQ